METENQDNLPRENEVYVESTPRQRLGYIARTVGKYTGLAALTAVSPPVGLGVWSRSFRGVLAGVMLNAVASVGCGIIQQERIYDSPNIYESRDSEETLGATIRAISGISLSLPLFYSATFPATTLFPATTPNDGDNSRVVYGKDVIEFDQSTYTLNFEPNRRFIGSEGRLVSLVEAEQRLDKLKTKGDILGARKAALDYEKVSSEYNSMRTLYEGAVDKMNAELGKLSQAGQTQ